MHRHLAVAALFFAGMAAGDAGASPPAASSSAPGTSPAKVSITAAPIFGTDAAGGEGWIELVVRVDDAGALPAKGLLEIESGYAGYSYGMSDAHSVRAPFHVQPHAEAVIRVPVRASSGSSSTLTVRATGDDGTKLAETTASINTSDAPLLVDVDEPSRLSVVMRNWPTALSWRPPASPYASAGSTLGLTVGSPPTDPTTGDVLLPEHVAGYSPATVVLLPSERLAHLQGPELDALVGWVLAGGTIAVFPTRPEDLRTGILTTLAGGRITSAAPPAVMMTLPGATRSGSATPPPLYPPAPSPPWAPSVPPTDAGAGATPIGFFVPVRTTPVGPGIPVGPSGRMRERLVGFTGGNLHPSGYGATAPYGLGQVHVLGFDPTSSPGLEDPWVHGRVLDMIADAWDRRALLVFPQGAGLRSSNLYEVHRALDPNENFRPALGIAAILLVLYSIAAGPLTFMRAKKKGRPLDPLVWAPIASAGCFALIVVVGLAGKGWSGRARHLALVEAGAGMSRGSVKRFRGFFASETRAMRVRSSEPASVLELLTTDSRDHEAPVLRLDKDGASLEDLTSLPWQTVVVGEDGFSELAGGVAVREKSDGSVVVANHTGKELRNVVVWAPKSDASWFQSIPDGQTVLSTSGRTLWAPAGRSVGSAGTRVVHELDVNRFSAVLGHAAEDMTSQWSAIAAAGGTATDWWPDDVPVVIGEVRGGEGSKSDGGLRVESDVLLFRVVGEGGAT
jgi:hypothetical protein